MDRSSDIDAERHRGEVGRRLDQRRRAVVARLDRGYDFVTARVSDEFWTRKSQEWEGELQAIDGELARMQQPRPPLLVTAAKILELAKQAEFLYKSQNPAEQRRLLETVLSNCTLDNGTLCPTYSKPFDLLVRGNETGEWRAQQDSEPLATSERESRRFPTGCCASHLANARWRAQQDSNLRPPGS